MKKQSLLLLLIISSVHSMEEKAWKPIDEETITEENAAKLRKEAEDRQEKAEEAAEKASKFDKIGFERAEKQAAYDKAIIEDKIARSGWEGWGFADIGNAEKAKKAKQEALQELTRGLSKTLEQIKNPQFVLQELPAQLETVIAVIPKDKSLGEAEISPINTIINIFSRDVDIQIEKLKKSSEVGFSELHDRTMQQIQDMENALKQQVEESDIVSPNFSKSMDNLQQKIKDARSEITSIAMARLVVQEEKQPGFLKRVAQNFIKWFKGLIADPSPTSTKIHTALNAQRKLLSAMQILNDFVFNNSETYISNLNDPYLVDKPRKTKTSIEEAKKWIETAKIFQKQQLDLEGIQFALASLKKLQVSGAEAKDLKKLLDDINTLSQKLYAGSMELQQKEGKEKLANRIDEVNQAISRGEKILKGKTGQIPQ